MHANSRVTHDLLEIWYSGGEHPPPPGLLLCKALMPSLPESGALVGTQIT